MEMASLPQGGTPVPAQRADATQAASGYLASLYGRLTPFGTPGVPRPEGLPPRLSLSEEARTAQEQGSVRLGTLGQPPATGRELKRQLTDQFDAASSSSKSSREVEEQKIK